MAHSLFSVQKFKVVIGIQMLVFRGNWTKHSLIICVSNCQLPLLAHSGLSWFVSITNFGLVSTHKTVACRQHSSVTFKISWGIKNMQYSYGWEKFHSAVLTLAGSGSQAQRLSDAFVFSLSHIRPEENLPEQLRADFGVLMVALTQKQAVADEGNAQATIFAMDEFEIHQSISKIIGLYDSICREMPKDY